MEQNPPGPPPAGAHLVLLSENLRQLRVNLLRFVRHLYVAVMHQDEVLVLVAGGGRHLKPQGSKSESAETEARPQAGYAAT